MHNPKDSLKINHFLQMTGPIVAELVEAILKATGCTIEQKGTALDLCFSIKAGDKETMFYLYNLLLEIATVDRDENPGDSMND